MKSIDKNSNKVLNIEVKLNRDYQNVIYIFKIFILDRIKKYLTLKYLGKIAMKEKEINNQNNIFRNNNNQDKIFRINNNSIIIRLLICQIFMFHGKNIR